MPTTTTFEERYKALNPSQKLAVDTIEGPVMVIAGPGTGKTSILTLRIANILLKTDTSPENILALTFTESGVHAMRKKLVAIIGNAGYRVRIHTFHSFCNEIIKQYPEYFPRIIGGSSIETAAQIASIETIITQGTFDLLKPFGDPLYYVTTIVGTIRDLKREGVTPEALQMFAEKQLEAVRTDDVYRNKKTGNLKGDAQTLEKKLLRTIELAAVFKAYQEALTQALQYDFEDMILEAMQALEQHEDLRTILQEEYQYLLADEHQDTNNAQNRILELLASFHDSPNLFIVGDEKQAIYRFQGASLENFLYFKGKYETAVLITLQTNYRSTQSILDVAHDLIAHNVVDDPMLRAELTAGNGEAGAPISVYGFSDERYEFQFLAQEISRQIEDGIDPNSIAVLYRNNGDGEKILPYLEQTNIPFTLHADQNLLHERDVVRLVTLLRAIANPLDDASVGTLLHMDFLHVAPMDAHALLQYARTQHIPVADALLRAEEVHMRDPDAVRVLAERFASWIQKAQDTVPLQLLEYILRDSGLLQHVLSHDASYERLAIIDSLFTEIGKIVGGKPYATLVDVLEHIALLETYNVRVPVRKAVQSNGVSLMTAHKSKGLEFSHVYIVGATDKRWGGSQHRTYFMLPLDVLSDTVKDADERRLFYVALTRAKMHVTITYGTQREDGKEQLPSSFISELRQELVSYEDAQRIEASLPGLLGAYPASLPVTAKSSHDVAYLQQLFLSQPFSVTALNNYLACPWQYFFRNLIRLPSTYSKHQQYGSAVHEALRRFFDGYAAGASSTAATLVELFEESLKTYVADTDLYAELLKKGEASLSAYVETWNGTWRKELKTEYSVHGISLPFTEGDLLLTGKLDKVEFLEDGSVHVVDYKTGKPKTRNELMGETKSGTGDYYRQLIFYKLLLGGMDQPQHMHAGSIEFIEPDAQGICKKETFTITDEDVAALAAEVKRVASEIYTLAFWNTRCDQQNCEFCSLRDVMPDTL